MIPPPIPPFHGNIGFSAHHSPMAAYFTFTCGHVGTTGGLAAQAGRPGNQDIFIGVKGGTRFAKTPLHCLPFFTDADKATAAASYLAGQVIAADSSRVMTYPLSALSRQYGWATDRWTTPDFTFSIYTPFGPIPDPSAASPDALRDALLPAITAELVVDNTQGTESATGFFAVNFERGLRLLDELPGHRTGFAHRDQLGMAAEIFDAETNERVDPPLAFLRWDPAAGIADPHNPVHLLGSCPGFAFEVLPGRSLVLRLAIGCYLPDVVTSRLHGRYLYARHYRNLADVLSAALDRFDDLKQQAEALDRQLVESKLNADQQFFLAHATRSYYGNSQLLEVEGEPFWIVNEGEYCMMNTLDLSLDQMFWELKYNPWVLKNLLENFARRYSYRDQLGVSFTHDMGANNQFSPGGHSAYELADLTGCFSYMTAEQLCNWVLIAASYVIATNDLAWARERAPLLEECLRSLIARGPKTGLIELDSSRCRSGAEITTYDSLDHSLAQTRNNLYMAVKTWAAYQGLQAINDLLGRPTPHAEEMSARIVARLRENQRPDGTLPAVFEKDNPGFASRILPAIEGLAYPLIWKRRELIPAEMLEILRKHTVALLSDPQRRNHFADGGVRLSSTSNNSWPSKINVFEYVARELFNLDENGQARKDGGAGGWEKSDAAHARWQTEGDSAYWACSDQVVNGVSKGSKYYPRGVTGILWMDERAGQK